MPAWCRTLNGAYKRSSLQRLIFLLCCDLQISMSVIMNDSLYPVISLRLLLLSLIPYPPGLLYSLLPEQSLHKRPFYVFRLSARQARLTRKSISARLSRQTWRNKPWRACQRAPQPNLLAVDCSAPPPHSSEDILFSPSRYYCQSLRKSGEWMNAFGRVHDGQVLVWKNQTETDCIGACA